MQWLFLSNKILHKKGKPNLNIKRFFFYEAFYETGAPLGIRTPGPMIKSHVL